MNYLRHLFILLTALLFISCSNREEEAATIATNFLDAYFATDYEKAASMCCEELSKELLESVKDLDSQSEDVKESLKKAAEKVTTVITSVIEKDKENIVVQYDIVMPDTSPINSSLTVKKVDKEWVIVEI